MCADSVLTQRVDTREDDNEFCAAQREVFRPGFDSDEKSPPAVIRRTRVVECGLPVSEVECFNLAVGTHSVGSRDINTIVLAAMLHRIITIL